jgi:hypothetical protein
LSLKDLGKQDIVDFKGRVKKIKRENNIEESNDKRGEQASFTNSEDVNKNIKGTGELKEGEEINF